MSSYGKDVESAREWLVKVGVDLARLGHAKNLEVSLFTDKLDVVVCCLNTFSEEQLLRLRCYPEAFNWKC